MDMDPLTLSHQLSAGFLKWTVVDTEAPQSAIQAACSRIPRLLIDLGLDADDVRPYLAKAHAQDFQPYDETLASFWIAIERVVLNELTAHCDPIDNPWSTDAEIALVPA